MLVSPSSPVVSSSSWWKTLRDGRLDMRSRYLYHGNMWDLGGFGGLLGLRRSAAVCGPKFQMLEASLGVQTIETEGGEVAALVGARVGQKLYMPSALLAKQPAAGRPRSLGAMQPASAKAHGSAGRRRCDEAGNVCCNNSADGARFRDHALQAGDCSRA